MLLGLITACDTLICPAGIVELTSGSGGSALICGTVCKAVADTIAGNPSTAINVGIPRLEIDSGNGVVAGNGRRKTSGGVLWTLMAASSDNCINGLSGGSGNATALSRPPILAGLSFTGKLRVRASGESALGGASGSVCAIALADECSGSGSGSGSVGQSATFLPVSMNARDQTGPSDGNGCLVDERRICGFASVIDEITGNCA